MMSTGDQTRQIATGKSALELRRTAVFFFRFHMAQR